MSEERAQQLLDEARELPNGAAKIAVLDEAIREADLVNWLEGSFEIREEMMQAAAFSGAGERLLTSFSWCLGKSDEMPEVFPDVDLLWQYKWSISAALNFAGISLQQIHSMLDDFSARLEKHGYGQRPVVSLHARLLQSVGDLEGAAAAAEQWQREPRDDMADCEACELDNVVELLCEMQQHDAAVAKAEPITTGKLTCAEVPHRTLAELLISAMRIGDETLAKKLHIRGYRMVYRDPDFLRSLGMHAVYIARQRDFKKGLDLMEKHMGWAMESLELANRKDFYVGCLAILQAMAGSGTARFKIRLPSTHPLHSTEGDCDTNQLAQWYEREIHELCEAFDRRNGTTWRTEQAKLWLSLA